MSLETVLLSRSVTFDPSLHAEVAKDIERFVSLGFTAYRQVGEIVTIPEAAAAADPEPVSDGQKRLLEAAEKIREMREKHRVSYTGIGALAGCSGSTIANLARGDAESVSADLLGRIASLWRRSRNISGSSGQFRVMANGASSAVRARSSGRVGGGRRRGPNLSDDQKLEIASLYESGKSVAEVAKLAGVARRTVRRVCKSLLK